MVDQWQSSEVETRYGHAVKVSIVIARVSPLLMSFKKIQQDDDKAVILADLGMAYIEADPCNSTWKKRLD